MTNLEKIFSFLNMEGLDPNNYDFTFTYPPFNLIDNVEFKEVDVENLEIEFIKDINIYINIPFCYNNCAYCYFPKSIKNFNEEYTTSLLNEIKVWGKKIKNKKVSNIFIGGGTPTYDMTLLKKIIEILSEEFSFDDNYEFTIETTPSLIGNIENLFKMFDKEGSNIIKPNRISMGIQSTNKDFLEFVERKNENLKKIEKAITVLRTLVNKNKIKTFNVDMLPGIIFSDFEEYFGILEKDLEFVTEKEIPQVTYYYFWTEQKIKIFKKLKYKMSSSQFNFLIHFIDDFMLSKNYHRDSFGWYKKNKNDIFRLQDSKYKDANYIGIGLGAYGYFEGKVYYHFNTMDVYNKNYKKIRVYELKEKEKIIRKIVLGLQRLNGITLLENDYNSIEKLLNNSDIKKYLIIENTNIKVNPDYWAIVPVIIRKFWQEFIYFIDEKYINYYKQNKRVKEEILEKDHNEIISKKTVEKAMNCYYKFIWKYLYIMTERDVIAFLPLYKGFKFLDEYFDWNIFNVGKKQYFDKTDYYKEKQEHNVILTNCNIEEKKSLTALFIKNKLEFIEIIINKNKESRKKEICELTGETRNTIFANINDINNINNINANINCLGEINWSDWKNNFIVNALILENENVEIIYVYYFLLYSDEQKFSNGAILYSTERLSTKDRINIFNILYNTLGYMYNYEVKRSYNLSLISSAISQIMSRNMSHNIGSHVVSDLIGSNEILPLSQTNAFYRYLQNRMDFIAQITTTIPDWSYPAYFSKELMRVFYENYILIDRINVSEGLSAYKWGKWKESETRGKIIFRTAIETKEEYIYIQKEDGGFIKIDKNGIKKEKEIAKDGIEFNSPLAIVIKNKEGIKDKLDNIEKHRIYYVNNNKGENNISEDDYKNLIEKVEEIETEKKEFKELLDELKLEDKEYTFKWIVNEFDDEEKTDEDVLLSVPGGMVGYHAFYSILENIMRNSAKHGYTNKTIKLEDKEYIYIQKEDGGFIKIDKNGTVEEITKDDIEPKETLAIVMFCKDKEGIKDKLDNIEKHRIYYVCNDNSNKCNGCHKGIHENNDNKVELTEHYITGKDYEKLKRIIKGDEEKSDELWRSVVNYLEYYPFRMNVKVIDDKESDWYWVHVWDSIPHKALVGYEKKDDKNNETYGEIQYKEEGEEKKKRELGDINIFGFTNDIFRESFVDLENGRIKPENWGMAELKICAGYLQQRDVLDIGGEGSYIIDDSVIEEEDESPNRGYPKMLIKAISVDKLGREIEKLEKGDIYYLGYRFWIKKSKEVMWIEKNGNSTEKE